jgi:hypothetical protein
VVSIPGCAMTHRESNIDGRCSMIEIMIRLRDRCALLLCPVDGGFCTTLWQFAEFKSYVDARIRGYVLILVSRASAG